MVRYKYLGRSAEGLLYAYYPEGREAAPGIIVITQKGSGRIVSESKEDFGKRYAHHAIRGIDPERKTGTVAWY